MSLLTSEEGRVAEESSDSAEIGTDDLRQVSSRVSAVATKRRCGCVVDQTSAEEVPTNIARLPYS